MPRHNRPHGLCFLCSDLLSVRLYKGFPNHVQSAELTTGGLKGGQEEWEEPELKYQPTTAVSKGLDTTFLEISKNMIFTCNNNNKTKMILGSLKY